MKRYTVTYIDKSDDVCTVWIMANNVEDAKFKVIKEYWDCKEVVDVILS